MPYTTYNLYVTYRISVIALLILACIDVQTTGPCEDRQELDAAVRCDEFGKFRPLQCNRTHCWLAQTDTCTHTHTHAVHLYLYYYVVNVQVCAT